MFRTQKGLNLKYIIFDQQFMYFPINLEIEAIYFFTKIPLHFTFIRPFRKLEHLGTGKKN
jgi:hypothetical protein